MITSEYNCFAKQLISSMSEFFKDEYFTSTVSSKKIKINFFGKHRQEIDYFVFRCNCATLAHRFKAQFEKFNICFTPQIYYCSQLMRISFKWFVNIDQWISHY